MEAAEIITRLEALLLEERAAIARLDGARVDILAREKRALAEALEARPKAERACCETALRRLVQNLKANGVLLAQARGILSEFLLGPGASLRRGPSASLTPRGSLVPRHLSVRG